MALVPTIARAVAAARQALRAGGLLATVSHVPAGTLNEYAEPTPGTPVSREAVVEDVHVAGRSPAGEDWVASSRVLLLEDVAVGLADRFVLPGSSVARRVLRVDRGVVPGSGAAFVVAVYVE